MIKYYLGQYEYCYLGMKGEIIRCLFLFVGQLFLFYNKGVILFIYGKGTK